MKLSEAIEKYGDCEVKKELIELIDVKSKTIYDLKEGDKYFCLSSDGEIPAYTFENEKFDKDCLSIGNVFLTKEEAQQHKEKLEVEAIFKKYSYNFSYQEWKNKEISKFFISSNFHKVDVSTYNNNFPCIPQGIIFFNSIEDCKNAINEVGFGRLIKYFKNNLL